MEASAHPWRRHPGDARFSDWAVPDGFVLRRMDWAPAAGAAPRGSLIFAAGRGDFIEKYLEEMADWRAAGWAVTAFDWRGQGRSQAGLDLRRLEGFDAQVNDLAALIADVRDTTPGPCVAIGHSMGGHILLRTIVERAPALDAAVLVAPMIEVNGGPIPAWLAPDIADLMARLGLRTHPLWKTPIALTRPGSQRQARLTGSRERYEDELYWWGENPTFNLGAPTWGWVRAAFVTAARLGAVRLPILILATPRDALVDPAAIRRVAAALPGAEIDWYPEARHEILREADPIRAVAMARIAAFLGRARA
jgi:lysophospholipase